MDNRSNEQSASHQGGNDLEQNRQPQGSGPPGIATVNGSDSQTPDQREAYIANEPDTKRVRSERKSVEDASSNQQTEE